MDEIKLGKYGQRGLVAHSPRESPAQKISCTHPGNVCLIHVSVRVALRSSVEIPSFVLAATACSIVK